MNAPLDPAPRRLNVLMVEDSENDALLIADALRRGGYELGWARVESAAELRAALARPPWHAILCDWRLPGFSALDAFAICREAEAGAPFLIVSGSSDEGLVAAAARAGIRVWVSKDHLERLPGAMAELGFTAPCAATASQPLGC
ncbi:MAG TPA: response regulator [Bryobacteraceae bacterium]|nr:response regulator [Bryobacteraceae bacterium]